MAAQTKVIDLGFRPRSWQAECFRSLRRFSVIVVHRRGGKTVMAVMKLIDAALRQARAKPPGRYAYIAPELKQAKQIAWAYFKHYGLKVPGAKVNESELWVEFPNGARITIYGADDPDRLRGVYFDGVVLDEVAQMKPETWGEVILPTLTDYQGWALFIGTPKGMNLFSELFFRAQDDSAWFAAAYDCYSTDALPPAEIETAKREMTESQFRQEMLLDFSASSENVLIPMDAVVAAQRRTYQEAHYQHAAKVLGVDVARQGKDRTVLQPRQGLAAFKPVIMRSADTMEVVARVASAVQRWKPDAVFVDGSGGYGAGVIDRLRQLGHAVHEVQFGGKPSDPRFLNKRAEMYWGIKEWVGAGGALPNMAEYKIELPAITYDHKNADGKLKLLDKEKMREDLGVSPDVADALALTFAMPVVPAGLTINAGTSNYKRDYDPYAAAEGGR